MKRIIQVFRTGRHTDSAGNTRDFTAEDLRAIADKFDPELGAAPLVKGHPKTDDPAFGWVKGFLFEETSGVLFAIPKDVDPEFKAEVNAKRFSRISIALYSPDSPNNPVPGQWYPRHIGFLGAASPAVTGLKAANFTNEEKILMFDFNNKEEAGKFETMLTNVLTKMGFKPQAEFTEPEAGGENVKDSAEFKALEAENAALETKVSDADKAAAKTASAVDLTTCSDFTEKLVTDGKLTPAEAGGISATLFALDNENEVEFTQGEGDKAETIKVPARKALMDFLEGLPKRVEFAELSGNDNDNLETVAFNAPAGSVVSPDAMAKHQRISAYSEKHNIAYVDAISIIENGVN